MAGHQPNFFPWFGYFEKMFRADIFVFSDDVRFPKQSYVNRVAIPVGGGDSEYQWVLPVLRGHDGRIADKRYMKDRKSLKKLLRTIEVNLGRLPHFGDVSAVLDEFTGAYETHGTVGELNIHMNRHIAGLLGIATPTRTGMELGLDKYRRTDRLVERCRLLGCDTYVCGQGSGGYMDPARFADSGLKLFYLNYLLGKRLLGDQLKYSVLVAIGQLGLDSVRDAFAHEPKSAGMVPA